MECSPWTVLLLSKWSLTGNVIALDAAWKAQPGRHQNTRYKQKNMEECSTSLGIKEMYTRHKLLVVSVQLIKTLKHDNGYIGSVLANMHFHRFPVGNATKTKAFPSSHSRVHCTTMSTCEKEVRSQWQWGSWSGAVHARKSDQRMQACSDTRGHLFLERDTGRVRSVKK